MSDDLRVLLWNPCPSPFGGHVVQMEMTAEYLSRLEGVSVSVSRDESADLRRLDIVHGFELETRHVREARRRGIAVCLSVIYWKKAFRAGFLRDRSRWQVAHDRARMIGVLALAAARGRHYAKSEAIAQSVINATALYESVDLLLPNSHQEANDLIADLAVTTPYRVVPNAADPARFPPGKPWSERAGVLFAGRLEPQKNQLGLIRALRGTGVPLTIVGGEHPHHPGYASAVRAAANGNVRVLGNVPHKVLADLYGHARVHAIPSEFETTGLVSLEAALSGCNVVTTSVGYAREYFGDLARYCNPHDPENIRSEVLAALSTPPPAALRQHVLENFTWEHTAAATLAGYQDLLNHAL